MQNPKQEKPNFFAEDVRQGLSASPKYLSSKYFYDEEGSRLFQKIMKLPEYYLTRAETEIFQLQAEKIFSVCNADKQPLNLIELGAGDGSKTAFLVEYLLDSATDFQYVPIDISAEAINSLTAKFNRQFPTLKISPELGDYFQTLETFKEKSARRKIILFLGSNIGNFGEQQTLDFFRLMAEFMNPQDYLLIGFDLHKDPKTILAAYDDSQGVTAAFNLNLLKRINRELGANFRVEDFSHYAIYNPINLAAQSFLVSRRPQTVFIKQLNQSFEFARHETIFMEISQKYSLPKIEEIAARTGFKVAANFFDKSYLFVDSIWQPV